MSYLVLRMIFLLLSFQICNIHTDTQSESKFILISQEKKKTLTPKRTVAESSVIYIMPGMKSN